MLHMVLLLRSNRAMAVIALRSFPTADAGGRTIQPRLSARFRLLSTVDAPGNDIL
jgi:hypothetical protein